MNHKTVVEAKVAAKIFLERVEAVLEAEHGNSMLYYGSKETAALRRSSMDLSRALSELRRSR